MSKQSDAKQSQNYRKQPMCCQHCESFSSDRVETKLAWSNRICIDEKNLRCSIGGFAVKKTASCDRFIARKAD